MNNELPDQSPNPFESPTPYGMPNPSYTRPPANDGFAITSMVCGIIAVLSCYFGGILGTVAVVFGHISLRKIKKDPNLGGKGMAIAGLVTGYIGIAFTVCSVIVFTLFATGMTKFSNTFKESFEQEMEKELEKQKRKVEQPAE